MSWISTVVKHARKMAEENHTNSKGDGICPWCNCLECSDGCDLGRIREAMGLPKIKAIVREEKK